MIRLGGSESNITPWVRRDFTNYYRYYVAEDRFFYLNVHEIFLMFILLMSCKLPQHYKRMMC